MGQLDMTIAGLSRKSGVSETTIRYIGRPGKRQKSTLVALSAALGFYPDYLTHKLNGWPERHDTGTLIPGMEQIMSEIRAGFERIIEKLDRLA